MHASQCRNRGAQPGVSVVIPAYNAAETIERALSSVYEQSYENISEVIVVDDGSTDDTAQIVRDKFPDVILIQQENGGNAAARNMGVAAAAGEYIAFLDADDEWLPEKTQVQVGAMEALPGLALTTCIETVGSQRPSIQPLNDDAVLDFFTFQDWLSSRPQSNGFALSLSGWVVRTNVYRSLGGLSEDFEACVDVEFLVRCSAAGYGLAGVYKPLMVRHYQPVSVSRGPGARLRRARMNLKLWRKYDPTAVSQRHRLLTEERFQLLLQKQLISLALAFVEAGDRSNARASAREAAGIHSTPWPARVKARLVAVCPALGELIHRVLRG